MINCWQKFVVQRSLDMVECRWLGIQLCSASLWIRQCVAGSLFGYVRQVAGYGRVSLARRSAMFGKSLDMVECRWLGVRLCSASLWIRQCVAGWLFFQVRRSLDMVECRWLGIQLCSASLWIRQCVAGSLFGYVRQVAGYGRVSLARRSAMFGKSLDMVECRWLGVRLCSASLWIRQCVAGWLFFQVRVVKWWLVRSWMLTGLLLCVDACCSGSTGVVWVVPPFIVFLECLVEVTTSAHVLKSRLRVAHDPILKRTTSWR
ncbi:uncharacterized protein LOC143919229 [Arctopsyche grandis]|uniref:uncharacterized protein LOC143919229 n=1 Tax=Arctopsyche grandis TaxID=121162 RepID=UPI00406D8DBB